MTTKAITPLRQRMIEDMKARKLCAGTQRGHIRACKRFAAFLKRSPDTATLEDIRLFQLHLAETDVSICTRNGIMTGLRFLFRVTLRRLDLAEEVYHIREPHKLPLVMSVDEIKRLLAVASSLKARVMFSLGYGCGLRGKRDRSSGNGRAPEVARHTLLYLGQPSFHFRPRKVLVTGVDGFELAAVSGDARARQQAKLSAKRDKSAAYLADRSTVILAEISNRLVIRNQPTREPHHLNVASGLALKPAARLNSIEVAVDVEFQQYRWMVRRPSG